MRGRAARIPLRARPRPRHQARTARPVPETVAGIQRERLIDAFVQIVSERGYGHTTISRVTEGAGVTKKTFYAHFTDLDDCFLAAYQRGMDILLGRMTQAYESAPSWPEGIHAALRTLLAVLAREPRFARASLVEVNAADPQVRRARIDNLARFRAFFTDPSLPPVPVAVVDAVVGGVYSAIHVRMETDETEDLPALLAPLTYFALLPFAGRETASAYLDPA